jgi:FMN phosphatase YigB (HAD superfamily)
MRKPNPLIYKLTLKKLKVKPSEAIFIDNQKWNILAAKKLAIMDAFEILKRVEEENNIIEGVVGDKNVSNKGFAEKFASKNK